MWECFEQQQPWKDLSPMQIIYAVGLQVTLLVLDYRQLVPGVVMSLAQFKFLESLHALPAAMMTCHGLTEYSAVHLCIAKKCAVAFSGRELKGCMASGITGLAEVVCFQVLHLYIVILLVLTCRKNV
jgi:hypothetical protein